MNVASEREGVDAKSEKAIWMSVRHIQNLQIQENEQIEGYRRIDMNSLIHPKDDVRAYTFEAT